MARGCLPTSLCAYKQRHSTVPLQEKKSVISPHLPPLVHRGLGLRILWLQYLHDQQRWERRRDEKRTRGKPVYLFPSFQPFYCTSSATQCVSASPHTERVNIS